MVGKQNSTILTVSYGTFSCTLEGFDDSFGMMKAIAEYFRDLAADDRYFGAEPPTPDVEMLAKIAEQNVARRVEARAEKGGVVLRPYQLEDTEDATPAKTAELVAPTHATAAAEPVAEKPTTPTVKAHPPAREFVDESDDFFGAAAHGAMLNEESVAARLQRIREAARAKASDAVVSDASVAEEKTPEAPVQSEKAMDDTPAEPITAPDREAVEEHAPALATDRDNDKTDAQAHAAQPVSFDEPEEDLEAEIDQLMALDGITEDVETSEDDNQIDAAASLSDDDELQALLGAIDTQNDNSATDLSDGDRIEAHADEAVSEPQDSEEIAQEAIADLAEDTAMSDDDEPTDSEPAAGTDQEVEPVQARIMHVKGTALQDMEDLSPDDLIGYDDSAYDASDLTIDEESLNAIFDEPKATSSLSEEEEADLMRELAAVESEEFSDEDGGLGDLLDADTEAVVADEEHLFTAKPEEALASAQDLSSLLTKHQADEELGRLMAETESQLSKPEHTRRKTTIQHLKAAFAAKRAEGDTVDHGNDSVAYREDFEMAVKPRRPILGSGRKTERLSSASAAPLKLVAEQRVVPDPKPAASEVRPTLVKPVRPRRIQTGSAAVAEDYAPADAISDQETPESKVDFPTFAEQMGVDKLPELLEAAASYMTFVQDFEKFSRPQVMTLVREVMGERYTREDGLRAFGQLLREHKLIRLEGGRFTVSDGIGFQPN